MIKALFAALILSAAFEPIGLWFAAIIGYALFFTGLRKSSNPVLHSLIFGLVSNAIILHWSSKYVGLLPWTFLATLQAVFYIPVGVIYRRTQSLPWAITALLVTEELRARFPFGGFSWTRIAFSQVDSPLLPLVSYGGVLFLTFVTLLLALALVKVTVKRISLILLTLLGAAFLPQQTVPTQELSLLAIQGNTPSVGLEFNSRAKAVFYLHRDLTLQVLQEQGQTDLTSERKYDAIIWPENAIDIDPRNYPEVALDIESLTAQFQMPLIAGVVLKNDGVPQNASVMYGADNVIASTYIKRYLTPFGEYMPLRPLAEFISPYASSVNDFSAGDSFVQHIISGQKVSPIICYEIINDGLVRTAALGSKALIVQTNSATFANTSQGAQQLAITRIRAVEHSRAILSVSTVGISAFIDNNGRVINQGLENESLALSGVLGLQDNITLADHLGGAAVLLTLLFSLIFAIKRPLRY